MNLGDLYKMTGEMILHGGLTLIMQEVVMTEKALQGTRLSFDQVLYHGLNKQPIVTLSSTELDFIAVVSCACQAVWLRNILYKLGQTHNQITVITCHNKPIIKLSMNAVMHGRCKFIDVRFYFLWTWLKMDFVSFKYMLSMCVDPMIVSCF